MNKQFIDYWKGKREEERREFQARIRQIEKNDRQIRIDRRLGKPVPAEVSVWEGIMKLRARIEKELKPRLQAIRAAEAFVDRPKRVCLI